MAIKYVIRDRRHKECEISVKKPYNMIMISQKFELNDWREHVFFLTPEMAKDLVYVLQNMLNQQPKITLWYGQNQDHKTTILG